MFLKGITKALRNNEKEKLKKKKSLEDGFYDSDDSDDSDSEAKAKKVKAIVDKGEPRQWHAQLMSCSGMFDCLTCLTCSIFPCCAAGFAYSRLYPGKSCGQSTLKYILFSTCWCCICPCLRGNYRDKRNIEGDSDRDFMVGIFLCCCHASQMFRDTIIDKKKQKRKALQSQKSTRQANAMRARSKRKMLSENSSSSSSSSSSESSSESSDTQQNNSPVKTPSKLENKLVDTSLPPELADIVDSDGKPLIPLSLPSGEKIESIEDIKKANSSGISIQMMLKASKHLKNKNNKLTINGTTTLNTADETENEGNEEEIEMNNDGNMIDNNDNIDDNDNADDADDESQEDNTNGIITNHAGTLDNEQSEEIKNNETKEHTICRACEQNETCSVM